MPWPQSAAAVGALWGMAACCGLQAGMRCCSVHLACTQRHSTTSQVMSCTALCLACAGFTMADVEAAGLGAKCKVVVNRCAWAG